MVTTGLKMVGIQRRIPTFDFSSLAAYKKSIVTNLGVKTNPSLKFGCHLNTAVKTSFFQLRNLSKIKTSFLSTT